MIRYMFRKMAFLALSSLLLAPRSGWCSPAAPFQSGTAADTGSHSGMQITDQNGDLFMEEDKSVEQPSKPKPKINVDLQNVGVQVDPSGQIIPLIQRDGGSVKPLYSNLQVYNEVILPPLIYPYPGTSYNPLIPLANNSWANQAIAPYWNNGQLSPYAVPFAYPSYGPYSGGVGVNLGLRLGRSAQLNINVSTGLGTGWMRSPLYQSPLADPNLVPFGNPAGPFNWLPPWRQMQSTSIISPLFHNNY